MRQARARLDHAEHHRLEVARAQAEEGFDPGHGRATHVAAQQQLLIGARIDDGRIADGIHPPGDAGIHLPQRDLVAHQDRRFQAGAAGALDVQSRGRGRQARGQHAFAHQVVVPGMLDDRPGDDIAQVLAGELVALDYRPEGFGQHVLVAGRGVGAIGPGKGDAQPADDCDASNLRAYEHMASVIAQECHVGLRLALNRGKMPRSTAQPGSP